MSKKHEKPANSPAAPFGAERRRSLAPLILWTVLFALWAVFLVVMAVRYPARG